MTDPIPTTDSRVLRPAGTIRLTAVSLGCYEVVRISDAGPARLATFRDRGLTPGSTLHLATGPTSAVISGVLDPEKKSVDLANEETDAVWVRPAEPPISP